MGEERKLRLQAPPVDGKANKALLKYLAKKLACRKQRLLILKGATSRHKTILISGAKSEKVQNRLHPAQKSVS